jgi:hypothetical protein
MAKWANDSAMDAMLQWIDDADTLTVCSAQPTTYAEATSTYKLADVTLTAGDGGGDYTIANGDVSGRKLTVAQQASVPIDSTGTATHVALCTVSGSVLRYVTTCTSQSLTSGGTVTVPAWDIEVADPT